MKLEQINRVAVAGAGTMGAGIGLCFAQAGYEVVLYDVLPEQLDKALTRIGAAQKVLVREAIVSREAAEEARQRISTALRLEEALDEAQFVLESIPERLTLKQEFLAKVESLCTPETILATNTSGLSITKIASVCEVPGRVAGMHWVNPPELVPLVEVIRGDQTHDGTADTIYELARKLGKRPVLVRKDVPGFAMNRLQFAVFREALHLVESGVLLAQDLDQTMSYGLGFRYPWLGPLKTADLGGLDVFHSVGSYLFKELSTMQSPPESFNTLIAAGKLGIKSGEGFYKYEEGAREQILEKRDLYFVRQWKLIREIQGA